MTTEQLDHLRAIDAHLDELLALAAKRTPGEWEIDSHVEVRTKGGASFIADCYEDGSQDAAYIAACAGRAEAGWRSTKAAIALSQEIKSVYHGGTTRALKIADEMQIAILAAWPRELLTLP